MENGQNKKGKTMVDKAKDVVDTGKKIVTDQIKDFERKNPGEAMLIKGAGMVAVDKAKKNPTAATIGAVGVLTGRTFTLAVATGVAEVATRNQEAVEGLSEKAGGAFGRLLRTGMSRAETLAGRLGEEFSAQADPIQADDETTDAQHDADITSEAENTAEQQPTQTEVPTFISRRGMK